MLSQKEAVNEVMSLYEERNRLIRENEELCIKINRMCEKKKDEEKNSITEKLARCGREMLAKQYANTWRDVFASRTENGDIRFDPSNFEEWASRKLNRLEISSHMSREDVFNALRSELYEIYDSEKVDAREFLLEQEANAKEKAE